MRRARGNKLTVDDFAGTTISLTNPGTIGTVHSVPRLMQGQGTIIGVGAMDYPAEFAGTSEEALNKMGVSKVLTLTSTYDHRIIQGAQSGDFLRIIGRKLLGEDGFYDRVFASLRVPYEPVRWVRESERPRRRGHQAGPHRRAHPLLPVARPPHGRHGPAGLPPAQAPGPRRADARPDPLGPRPHVPDGRLRRQAPRQAARGARACCATRTAARSAASTCTCRTRGSAAGCRSASSRATPARRARTSCGSCAASTRRRPSRPSCRPSTSARSGSRSRAASPSSRCSTRSCPRPRTTVSTRSASAWPTAAG